MRAVVRSSGSDAGRSKPQPRSGRVALPILLLLATAAQAFAFTGRVVREDGTPVPDAVITILGRAGTARAGADGRFTWAPDPPLPFRILVTLPGGEIAAPVLVARWPGGAARARVLDVVIRPLAEEPVTVVAEAAPNIESPPANALDLVGEEDLKRRAPERLTEAVGVLPGVSFIGQSHDAVPSIRGLARGRTLILLDGARMTSERRAGPSASFLDPFFLDSVEVSRGPGSVAYGSDAFGGVIHARTPEADPGSGWSGRFISGAGAGVPTWSMGAEIARGLRDGGFLFQGRLRRFDDYDAPTGEIENSSARDYGLLGRFDHEAGPGRISVILRSDRSRDAERPSSEPSPVVDRPRDELDLFTVAYDFDPFEDATLVSLGAYAADTRVVTTREDLPDPPDPGLFQASDIRARDLGLRATVTRPLDNARVSFGADFYGRADLEALTRVGGVEERSVEDADAFDTGLFVGGESLVGDAITLSGGLRYDVAVTANSGGSLGDRSTRHAALSGHASVTVSPWRTVSVTGQIARGFREPTLSARYFTGVSGRGLVTGNPALDPETSLQYDLSVRLTRERMRAAFYAYHYRIEDLIERFEMGDGLFFFRNLGEATLQGLEAEIGVRIGAGIDLEVGATLARGEADDGSALDDVPQENVTLVLRRSVARGYVEVRAAAYARDEDPGPTEAILPGYALWGAGGGWRLSEAVELRLTLRNLLDQDHPAGPDRRGPAAPGRSAWFGLVAKLGG